MFNNLGSLHWGDKRKLREAAAYTCHICNQVKLHHIIPEYTLCSHSNCQIWDIPPAEVVGFWHTSPGREWDVPSKLPDLVYPTRESMGYPIKIAGSGISHQEEHGISHQNCWIWDIPPGREWDVPLNFPDLWDVSPIG
jgi:hypothetical protein